MGARASSPLENPPLINDVEDLLQHHKVTKECACKKCPENFLITKVAGIIADWKALAPYFGMSGADIVAIERDGVNEEDRRRKLLQKWLERNGHNGTYYKLVEAFIGAEDKNTADEICRHLADEGKEECLKFKKVKVSEKDTEALPGKPTESLTPLAKDSDVHSVQSSSSHPSTSSASSSSHDLDHQSVPTSNENQPCHCVLPPCCHRVLAVFLAVSLVILVVAMVMVGVSSGYPPLHQQVKSIPHRIVLQKNQVQKIDCFNPENVDKVTVNQLHSATNVQLMGTVSLALVPRESLTPHWDNRTLLNYTFGSNLVTNYPLQKWEPFAYMLAGSSVNVTINVTVSTTLMPLGSLNEYNDYEKYIQFSQGTTNEPKPYQRFPINTIVGTAVTTPIVVHEDGFVLFGVYLPPSSWYLYAYSFHRLYYKSSDYSFDCTLYDEDSLCHLSVTDSRHSELCLMASTQGDEFDDEGPEFVEASYTIVTQEFCVVIIAVSGAVFVAAVVVSCIVWACRRRMRPG